MSNYIEDKNNKILQLALEKLNLRFPVSEISNKTGTSKGNVSNFVNNKKPVSDNFLKVFIEQFGLSLTELTKEIELLKIENSDFNSMYLASGVEEKFVGINDNDLSLYVKYNKHRLLKNKLFNSIIKKEAWVIINNELSKDILEDKKQS
ncbi:hypothetical protein [Tenacibaculum amylolyticum]|uniref:hypothetical protein n=1 Tax=Tenacibaculum amylolyticum TaxID=104269 RepID=UPI003895E7AD